MPSTEDRQVLRHLEMIARVRPSRESTQRALDRVRRQLVAGSMPKAPTGPRIIQLITSHAAVKAAIAACIVVAVTLTLVFSRPRPTVRPTAVLTPGPIPTRPVVKPEDSQLARDLQTQLQQVETLYSARDVDGLMGLLEEGALKAKVAAAQRLADLRDPRAIETLSRLAAQWTAGPERNPFEIEDATVPPAELIELDAVIKHPHAREIAAHGRDLWRGEKSAAKRRDARDAFEQLAK